MLLIVEKGLRGGIKYSSYQYRKYNSKCIKNYVKNKESQYLQYWDVNRFDVWVMPEQPPVNNFQWIKDTCQFDDVFIKKL